jgi:hypothetical protein
MVHTPCQNDRVVGKTGAPFPHQRTKVLIILNACAAKSKGNPAQF